MEEEINNNEKLDLKSENSNNEEDQIKNQDDNENLEEAQNIEENQEQNENWENQEENEEKQENSEIQEIPENQEENNENSEIQENPEDSPLKNEDNIPQENLRYNENDNNEIKENNENEDNNSNKENDNDNKYNNENLPEIPSINTPGKIPKNRRLPKLSKIPKSLTENSINHLTTNLTETKRDPEYEIMSKKIHEFLSPKIRNEHYLKLNKINKIFLEKKNIYDKEKKIFTIEDLEAERRAQMEKLKNPFKLTDTETRKYLDIYNTSELSQDIQNLKATYNQKNYRSSEFNNTKFSELKSYKIFYAKMRKDTEIIRKGGLGLMTPSFNFIRATKKFNAVPNPVGVVKRKGDIGKMDMRNKLCGDNYVKCLCEALKISEHITEINLKNNRLSDISIIPLINTVIHNHFLLKQLTNIDLSFNKLSFAGTTLICQYMSEYDCNLEHLNLEKNNLGNNNTKKIIKAVYEYLEIKIKYLNFAQNLLNDEISTDLTILLNKCIYLNVLILYQNQFTNQGAGLMMSEIKKHSNLKILDFSWNLIGTNLTDEIPTLDELVKASAKSEVKKNFDNAYLNELIFTMQFRRPGTLSPVRVGSKVSYFTSQLCELFHNKNTELLHLDISYNNINTVDAKAISEHIKDNHTILGIHVDGNDMWVDELGFVHPIEKSKYKQNHFAQSQIFYRITNDHPLASSSIINVQKIRSKNNCWICEGWREIKFHYKPNNYEGNLESAYVHLHLNFENYKPYQLNFEDGSFVCHRMCPSGNLTFFLTMNGIPVDSYGPITHELKDAIIYTQVAKPKEFEDDDDNNSEQNEEPKKFIITKVAQTKVEINPEVISTEGNYLKNIKYCFPRPEKNMLKKRPRTPWSFSSSIWAYYGYDYEGEPESAYNNAFEFDYDRCNFSKDKDLSADDEIDLKNILRSRYKKMIETYKNLSAYLGWKIWQIGQNQITEFVSNCPELLDKNYLINDVLVKVTEVKSNAIDKQDRKKNNNIPDNIIRHQFMMLLVKIAKDKYFRTKQMPSIVEAVDYSFEHHYDYYINQFDSHKWRKERYYNEEVDNILKAFIPIFDALFYSYAPQQIMGRKDSFWLTLEGYTNMCNNLMDSDFPVKELPVLFSLSLRLTTNEIDYDKHYNMVFPEFLEAICRFIDKLSPIPKGEDFTKWDMKRRQAQKLKTKIETMIPALTRLISGNYRNVRDKFVTPAKEEDVDLYKIDYENPLYEGKLPKKVKKKRNSVIMG